MWDNENVTGEQAQALDYSAAQDSSQTNAAPPQFVWFYMIIAGR